MFKNLIICIAFIPCLSLATGTKQHTLDCNDQSKTLRPQFGLATDLQGTALIGTMVVANSRTWAEKKFKYPIFPTRSYDMVKSRNFEDSPHFSYALGLENNGCTYTFKAPIDMMDYFKINQTGVQNSFTALWIVSGPDCSLQYKEIELTCHFVN